MPPVKTPRAAGMNVGFVQKRDKRRELISNILMSESGMHTFLTIELEQREAKGHDRIY